MVAGWYNVERHWRSKIIFQVFAVGNDILVESRHLSLTLQIDHQKEGQSQTHSLKKEAFLCGENKAVNVVVCTFFFFFSQMSGCASRWTEGSSWRWGRRQGVKCKTQTANRNFPHLPFVIQIRPLGIYSADLSDWGSTLSQLASALFRRLSARPPVKEQNHEKLKATQLRAPAIANSPLEPVRPCSHCQPKSSFLSIQIETGWLFVVWTVQLTWNLISITSRLKPDVVWIVTNNLKFDFCKPDWNYHQEVVSLGQMHLSVDSAEHIGQCSKVWATHPLN